MKTDLYTKTVLTVTVLSLVWIAISDYVVSKAFNRGLVRYKTIAEGSDKCDFRFKKGRKTFVHPLKEGWPPRFLDTDIAS